MKPTIPPIDSPDHLFHDGDDATQRDGTTLTSVHLNNMQAAVISMQDEIVAVLTQAGLTPAEATKGQLLDAITKVIMQQPLLKQSANLSDLVDRAAAWLNVRPTGSTPIAADPVNPYDATTKRWVENLVGAGSAGPTMNGVMNYGVGTPHLQDSRAYLAPYNVYSDGQLLDRAIWPELWAFAQMQTPITDAAWIADPLQRGKYSLGNGTTTFRVPDKNGVQKQGVNGFTGPDSISSLYGRGDGGLSALDGTVTKSGAPNITGQFSAALAGAIGTILSPSGAFNIPANSNNTAAPNPNGTNTGANRDTFIAFDASKSNSIYGGTITEIRTNSFFGAWVIRASGGFVAANTSWSVINADTVLPAAGVTVTGGRVISEYKAANHSYATAEMAASRASGNPTANVKITASAYDPATGVVTQTADLLFGSDGLLNTPGAVRSSVQFEVRNAQYPIFAMFPTGANTNAIGGMSYLQSFMSDSLSGTISDVYLARRRADNTPAGQITNAFPKSGGTLALQGTSGRDFKKDIVDADPQEALNRILALRMVNYVYKDDEQERVRFGIIAEEAEQVADQYIKHNAEPIEDILNDEGEKVGVVTRDRPSVDGNPIIMDLLGAVQALQAKVDALTSEIAELKK